MIRIDHEHLTRVSRDLLIAAGMERDKAEVTAEVLVEGDMIGHDTHGVGLMPWYVDALRTGDMEGAGDYEVLSDRGACFVWRGRTLPGAYLVTRALEQACDRASEHGVVTAAIRDSHHTCALSAFMRKVTERGFIVQLSCSNPAAARMAPFGGTAPLLTPNPNAAGFPTSDDPIMIDVSCSITTVTMANNLAARGERFPDAWAQTADGTPTDDPKAFTEGGGSLLPLGGALKGHKGYALALMIELLGQGLSGKGRANTELGRIAQSIFLQVIDPEAFSGLEAFKAQSDHLAAACRANPPAVGRDAVRLPGDSAARKRRDALKNGVPLLPEQVAALNALAQQFGMEPVSEAG